MTDPELEGFLPILAQPVTPLSYPASLARNVRVMADLRHTLPESADHFHASAVAYGTALRLWLEDAGITKAGQLGIILTLEDACELACQVACDPDHYPDCPNHVDYNPPLPAREEATP